MQRVSGWYARTARRWLFGIAILVTVATNASTLSIAERIWQDDTLRAFLADQAVRLSEETKPEALTSQLADMGRLPLGWTGNEAWDIGWIA